MSHAAPVRAILFDMDNTLLDWSGFSGDWATMEQKHLRNVYAYAAEMQRPLAVEFERFAEIYRQKVIDAWAVARSNLRAPAMRHILQHTLNLLGSRTDDEAIDDCLRAYAWQGAEGVIPFPDVAAALAALRERGIAIGLITNAFQPIWMREIELERHGLLQYFQQQDLRLTAADVGYLKPHPRIFQHVLEVLELPPEQVLYVGDNPVADIAGAQGVGMRAVLRVNQPAPPLISGLIVPDAAVNTLLELLPLVDGALQES